TQKLSDVTAADISGSRAHPPSDPAFNLLSPRQKSPILLKSALQQPPLLQQGVMDDLDSVPRAHQQSGLDQALYNLLNNCPLVIIARKGAQRSAPAGIRYAQMLVSKMYEVGQNPKSKGTLGFLNASDFPVCPIRQAPGDTAHFTYVSIVCQFSIA